MALRMLGGVLGLLLLVGGCATTPLPGAGGEVSGPLRSIELYVGRPEHRVPYRTMWRDRLFVSDREVYVGLYWELPRPGDHVAKVALRTPAGAIQSERESPFRADTTAWFMWHPVMLQIGEGAKSHAGPWQVEVTLDGAPVGRRTFALDPSSIRVRTDARVVVVQGSDHPEVAAGDWVWRNRAAVLDSVKAAHAMLGIALRDELARRFPQVEGPRQGQEERGATVLLRTNFTVSPNPDADARLALDIVHVPTQTTRTFHFRSSEGVEQMGATRSRDIQVAATHLAFLAAASPEVLETLVTSTKAVPE